MSFVNLHSREISVKVVYYGPGLGGKTSSLQHIHSSVRPEHRGQLVSLATSIDRTLYFDFLPVKLPKIKDYTIRMSLYTVPGQVHYNATRKLVLEGADGVVFVADSQVSRREANVESLHNLHDNLLGHGMNPNTIPMVMQLNKRDLQEILPVRDLEEDLNTRGVPTFETCALNGRNIMATLKAVTKLVLADLKKKGIYQDTDSKSAKSFRSAPVVRPKVEDGLVKALETHIQRHHSGTFPAVSPDPDSGPDPDPDPKQQEKPKAEPTPEPKPSPAPSPAATSNSTGTGASHDAGAPPPQTGLSRHSSGAWSVDFGEEEDEATQEQRLQQEAERFGLTLKNGSNGGGKDPSTGKQSSPEVFASPGPTGPFGELELDLDEEEKDTGRYPEVGAVDERAERTVSFSDLWKPGVFRALVLALESEVARGQYGAALERAQGLLVEMLGDGTSSGHLKGREGGQATHSKPLQNDVTAWAEPLLILGVHGQAYARFKAICDKETPSKIDALFALFFLTDIASRLDHLQG